MGARDRRFESGRPDHHLRHRRRSVTAESEPPLKRESAGHYRTRDGRFGVEQDSGRWLVVDSEQADELGLPRVRGPFGTLDDAREAIRQAREEPQAASPLEARLRAAKDKPASAPPDRESPDTKRSGRRSTTRTTRSTRSRTATAAEAGLESEPEPEPPAIRRLEPRDVGLLLQISKESDEYESVAGIGSTSRQPLSRADAKSFLEAGDVHLLVAEAAGQVVAFLVAYVLLRRAGEPRILLVDELAVRSARRREGIGSRLFDALAALARDRGIEAGYALTNTWNGAAVSFYRSVGAVRAKDDDAVFVLDFSGHRSGKSGDQSHRRS